ncbi:hypothetical protein ACWDBD_38985 [Streptomyces sp. NPDC001118]|uniref:hypothetical protein n=1 Tax=Streptomyces sp. NPDC001127 TaxID=3154377 RepID=UPI00332B5C9D
MELQFLGQPVEPNSPCTFDREDKSDHTSASFLNLAIGDVRVLIEKNVYDFPLKGVPASSVHFPSPFLIST